MGDTLSILIVDDNIKAALSLADVLMIKGYKSYLASSGQKALSILRDQPIDVLLTDIIMPEMDGVTLFHKARQVFPDLITILMTAYASDDLLTHDNAEGIETIFIKPIDIDDLLALLARIKWKLFGIN